MLIYIASPYTPLNKALTHDEATLFRHRRYEQVCAFAAERMETELNNEFFVPIAHSHPIEQFMNSPKDGEFWLRHDFAILKHCQMLYVYMLEGWADSHGVQAEIDFAKQHNIPIVYFPIY